MKDTEIKQIRDHDLYNTYKMALRQGHFGSMKEAADFARRQPASQFYISASEASSHIGKILTCRSLIDLNHHSRKRIWKLYELYQKYLQDNPNTNLSREKILEHLVQCPAPEFYLSLDRAKHIIIYEQKKIREQAKMK